MSFLRFLMLLSLVTWIGGLIFFAFVLAPTAFQVLPNTHLAGNVVGRALGKLHWIAIISGIVFLASSLIYSRLADGTAVVAETTAALFAKLPGVRFPDRIERPVRLDFGPELGHGVVTELPPKVGAPFVTFVSAVDADGNEIAGVRPVELLAPLATFTGWNPRHPEQGAPGDLMSMMGSTLPFPRTRAERLATDDPRRSIEERYPSRAAYLEKARAAALALVAARHVLAEDLDPLVERAGRLWDWVHARV